MNDLENLYADRRTAELQRIASKRAYAAARAAFDYDEEYIESRFGPNCLQGMEDRKPVDRDLLVRAFLRREDSERARHLAGAAMVYDIEAMSRLDAVIAELELPK